MFNCQVCGKTSKPQEKPIKEVVQSRKKLYKKPNGDTVEGFETVREIMRHKECNREK